MLMRYFLVIAVIVLFSFNCKSYSGSSQVINNENEYAIEKSDSVVINSPENDYEIIIIEPGFNTWLQSIARPEGYYSQNFLENRNQIYVTEWNIRVNQPLRFNPNLYQLAIDYDRYTDYGYEVNYKLYNYFIYFQLTYKQRLGPFVPRI